MDPRAEYESVLLRRFFSISRAEKRIVCIKRKTPVPIGRRMGQRIDARKKESFQYFLIYHNVLLPIVRRQTENTFEYDKKITQSSMNRWTNTREQYFLFSCKNSLLIIGMGS